jgi:hypothetical protein
MDHGRLFAMPDASAEQIDRFRGISLTEAARAIDLNVLRDLEPFRELEIGAVGGLPVMVARSTHDASIYWASAGETTVGRELPSSLVLTGVRNAWPQFDIVSSAQMAAGDAYTQLRQSELPKTTLRVKLNDENETWVHVDQQTGQILAVVDRGRRLYRWLYNGLHSLDFPGFVNHRPLWDLVILSFMALGFTFSLTGAVVGLKSLGRSLKRRSTTLGD